MRDRAGTHAVQDVELYGTMVAFAAADWYSVLVLEWLLEQSSACITLTESRRPTHLERHHITSETFPLNTEEAGDVVAEDHRHVVTATRFNEDEVSASRLQIILFLMHT